MKCFLKNTLTLELESSRIGLSQNRKGGDQMRKRQYTLKELRARYNLTQRQTAKLLGISMQTYNAWEQDFGKVKSINASKVAALFGVTVDEIFFEDKLESNSSKVDN